MKDKYLPLQCGLYVLSNFMILCGKNKYHSMMIRQEGWIRDLQTGLDENQDAGDEDTQEEEAGIDGLSSAEAKGGKGGKGDTKI